VDNEFYNFSGGTIATNGLGSMHKALNTPAYVTMYFDTPIFANSTTFTGNASMFENSNIIIKNQNNVSHANYRYTNNGESEFTGPSLSDTTVPNIGTYAIKHSPITSVGMKYIYRQLATPGTKFVTEGTIWGNSTFVSDSNTTVTVDVYLPGLVPGFNTPSISHTMTKTTDKTSSDAGYLLNTLVPGTYGVDVAQDAQIVVTFKNPSATAGASAWIGDLLDAENATTKFEDVFRGQPQDVMPSSVGDSPGLVAKTVEAILPAAIWGDTETYPTSSKGYDVKSILSNSDATQAKVDIL
jgi:hypothetical protein